jgi:ATP-binding cassette subfamily B protein/subfamily B ATP-binding cassette protein MsbA
MLRAGERSQQITVGVGRYKRLLRYAAAGLRGWILILALALFTSLFSLLQPWPMKVVVDHALGQQPMGELAARGTQLLPGGETPQGLLSWMVLATLVIFAVHSAADVLLSRAWVQVGQRMVYQLAGDLFAHTQRRSLLFHTQSSVGDSMSRITGDSWCVYKVVDALLFSPGYAFVAIAGMVVLMARMDLSLTLVALAVAPLMAAVSIGFGRPIRRAATVRREIESQLQAHVQRILTGIHVVQAFSQEDREDRRFRKCTASALRSQFRVTLVAGLYNLACGLILTLGIGAVLWVGVRHVMDARLTVGGLLVFLAYLTVLQDQLKAFTGIYSAIQETAAGANRVLEMLDADQELADRPGALAVAVVRGHVRLENIAFGYEPGRPVLRDISLDIPSGRNVAIVGQTGAGKTTLVSLVARFFDPWQGQITLDGHDLRALQLRSLRSQVALVLQESFLFPITIAENIAYGRPGASQSEIENAARAAHLHEFIVELPRGYDTVVGERGVTLSGGERQRLSIARALLKDAPILILDEPTGALDSITECQLLVAMRRLMKGRTTFIIAHRLSTIRDADQIVVLQEGRIAEAGSHDELLQQGGVYARLYQTQTRRRDLRNGLETAPRQESGYAGLTAPGGLVQ